MKIKKSKIRKIIREELDNIIIQEDRVTDVQVSASNSFHIKKAAVQIAKEIMKDMSMKKFNKTGTKEIMDQLKPQFKKGSGQQKININMTKVVKMNDLGNF